MEQFRVLIDGKQRDDLDMHLVDKHVYFKIPLLNGMAAIVESICSIDGLPVSVVYPPKGVIKMKDEWPQILKVLKGGHYRTKPFGSSTKYRDVQDPMRIVHTLVIQKK
jgi:hypothetical protein